MHLFLRIVKYIFQPLLPTVIALQSLYIQQSRCLSSPDTQALFGRSVSIKIPMKLVHMNSCEEQVFGLLCTEKCDSDSVRNGIEYLIFNKDSKRRWEGNISLD